MKNRNETLNVNMLSIMSINVMLKICTPKVRKYSAFLTKNMNFCYQGTGEGLSYSRYLLK